MHAQLCLTLCDLVDYNPPGSSVHGIFPTRIVEWAATSSPGDLPDPGIEPVSLALQANSLPLEPSGKPINVKEGILSKWQNVILEKTSKSEILKLQDCARNYNKLFCGREEICMCINCRDRTSQKKKIVTRKLHNTWKLQNSFTIRTPLKKDVTFDDIRVEKTDHGQLKTNVKERDETWVGTKSNTLMGLAFFFFILIWKKLKKNYSNIVKAQCQEERTTITWIPHIAYSFGKVEIFWIWLWLSGNTWIMRKSETQAHFGPWT